MLKRLLTILACLSLSVLLGGWQFTIPYATGANAHSSGGGTVNYGYQTIGGTGSTQINGQFDGISITTGSDASGYSSPTIYAYLYPSSGTTNMLAFIYAGAGSGTTPVCYSTTAVSLSGSAQWLAFPLTGCGNLAANTTYTIGVVGQLGYDVYYDGGSGYNFYYYVGIYGTWPNPVNFTAYSGANNMSIYVTVTQN